MLFRKEKCFFQKMKLKFKKTLRKTHFFNTQNIVFFIIFLFYLSIWKKIAFLLTNKKFKTNKIL